MNSDHASRWVSTTGRKPAECPFHLRHATRAGTLYPASAAPHERRLAERCRTSRENRRDGRLRTACADRCSRAGVGWLTLNQPQRSATRSPRRRWSWGSSRRWMRSRRTRASAPLSSRVPVACSARVPTSANLADRHGREPRQHLRRFPARGRVARCRRWQRSTGPPSVPA